MAAFSRMLSERARPKLDVEECEYLDFIGDGAKRMTELIDGLLEYSRASFQRDTVCVDSDVNALLQHALENLRIVIAQTGAIITSDNLPTLCCAPLNIVQLFQNLIGNAVKYSVPGIPKIHISASDEEAGCVFCVRDHGIGIDRAYHEQIFGVFRRLHGREYSGTGIGLAICKAIVEKHGGTIWVESELGQGARFFFKLPKIK